MPAPTVAIPGMKKSVLAMIKEVYGDTKPAKPTSDAAIQKAGYVRDQDAKQIRHACSKFKLTASFREAGLLTLQRIDDGNPCKGHDVMHKSIKLRGGSKPTYVADKDVFKELQGLVGVPEGSGDPPKLWGIWIAEEVNGKSKAVQKELSEFMSLGKEEKEAFLLKGFTGDYDMHDLIKDFGKQVVRIPAGTPEEEAAIEHLNKAMLKADPKRFEKVKADKPSRLRESNYALIRHGAQTSYYSYLLGAGAWELTSGKVKAEKSKDGKYLIPDQEKIANISSDICVFNPEGEAYILKDEGQIYKYYEEHKLLEQIPFYFFFEPLVKKHGKDLQPFIKKITKYLTGKELPKDEVAK